MEIKETTFHGKKMLQGLSLSQARNLTEITVSGDTPNKLRDNINTALLATPNSFMVSKATVYNPETHSYSAFITLANL